MFLKGGPVNPVSLLQMADVDYVVIVQLSFMWRYDVNGERVLDMPRELRRIMEDAGVIKLGVGIAGTPSPFLPFHSNSSYINLNGMCR